MLLLFLFLLHFLFLIPPQWEQRATERWHRKGAGMRMGMGMVMVMGMGV
jgi:hypothetical protein